MAKKGVGKKGRRLPDDAPDAAEFGQLRAHLARMGWTQAQIRAAIGQNGNGRNRRAIGRALATWIKNQG